jgi:hypothetical protein
LKPRSGGPPARVFQIQAKGVHRRSLQRTLHPALAAAVAAGVAIRLYLLVIPAAYVTDVYYYDVQAVAYLLKGVDPYGALYAVPSALSTPGASHVFAYLPGVFAFLGPASAVWNPRFGLVLSDVVVGTTLLFLGRRKGFYSALYLLFPPTILFSTWFLNDALASMAFLSAAILLEARGRPMASAPFWGLAAAASQEAWLLFPLYAVYCLRRRTYSEVLVALGCAAAVVAPFMLWNPSALVYDTALFQFARQTAPFFSTGPFGLNVNPSLQGILLSFGTSAPILARGAVAGLALLLTARYVDGSLPRLMLACTIFAAVGLFLLAGDLFWSYFELPFLTLLSWAALREPKGDQSKAVPLKA